MGDQPHEQRRCQKPDHYTYGGGGDVSDDYPKEVLSKPAHASTYASYHQPTDAPYGISIITQSSDEASKEPEQTFTIPELYMPKAGASYTVYIYRAQNGELVVEAGTITRPLDQGDTENPPEPPAEGTPTYPLIIRNVTADANAQAVSFKLGGNDPIEVDGPNSGDEVLWYFPAGQYQVQATLYNPPNETPTVTTNARNVPIIVPNDSQSWHTLYMWIYKTRSGGYGTTTVWPPNPNDAADIDMDAVTGDGSGLLKIINKSETGDFLKNIRILTVGGGNAPGATEFGKDGNPSFTKDMEWTTALQPGFYTVEFMPSRQNFYGITLTVQIKKSEVTTVSYYDRLANPDLPPTDEGYGSGLIKIVNKTTTGVVNAVDIRDTNDGDWLMTYTYVQFTPSSPINYNSTGRIGVAGTAAFPITEGAHYMIQVGLGLPGRTVVIERLAAIKDQVVEIVINDSDIPSEPVAVFVPVTNITLSQNSISSTIGTSADLFSTTPLNLSAVAGVYPENATTKSPVTWELLSGGTYADLDDGIITVKPRTGAAADTQQISVRARIDNAAGSADARIPYTQSFTITLNYTVTTVTPPTVSPPAGEALTNGIYVAVKGDDSWPGTINWPVRSLWKAVEIAKTRTDLKVFVLGELIPGPLDDNNDTDTRSAFVLNNNTNYHVVAIEGKKWDGDGNGSKEDPALTPAPADTNKRVLAVLNSTRITLQKIIVYGGSITGTNATAAYDTNDSGGGIYIHGANSGVSLEVDSVVRNNTSQIAGGGVAVHGGSDLILYNGATIRNNAVTSGALGGGGVYVLNGRLQIGDNGNDGFIDSNTSAAAGGGVYLAANGTFTLNKGGIRNNTAAGSGGGVYIAETSSKFTMTSNLGGAESVISGNQAGGAGGGVAKGTTAAAAGTFVKKAGTIYGSGQSGNTSGTGFGHAYSLRPANPSSGQYSNATTTGAVSQADLDK
ncbi:MAG: hypothetical protein LBQ35_04880 [Spirochaetaceae bacterium]|nr:hypothetical protein [Spirochaetaceae bacterium]